MLLEDRLVRNLTREAIEKVLKPKVQGSEILDQLTRQDGLDYFLLFSSSAVLFGNPGQANYVAANAYMDAVAQRRKAAGLPALSVQWGAITDVGILARKQATTKSLSRHAGGIEFKARQGLELMGQLLANHRQLGHPAAVALAATDWSLVGDSLPIMRSPTLELMAREASMGTQTTETLDLQSLIEGLSDNQARERIAELIAQEAAHIFRMPVQQIKRQHSLVELGMDSLMAIELIVASEQKLGIEVPTSSIGQGTTINDLAMEVLHRIRRNNEVEQEPSVLNQSIARQHLAEDINPEQLNAIASKVADQGS
jgi:acyl carrier protein